MNVGLTQGEFMMKIHDETTTDYEKKSVDRSDIFLCYMVRF